MIIVLVGASGSGKSTLEKLICKEFEMNKIISSTTRPMRKNEVNNVDYHFFEIVSFYINVDQRSRLIKLLQRGDDIVECYRRSLSDVGQFDDVEEETDYVIKNYEYRFTPEQMLKHIEDGLFAYHYYHERTVGKILGV